MTKEETLRDEIALYVVQRVGELRPIPNDAEPYMMLVSTDELIKIVSDAFLSAPQDRDVGDREDILHKVAEIRDEYRVARMSALDQMEFNAAQGNTKEVSEYSTEAERHGAALLASNRILKLLSSTPPSVAVPEGWQLVPKEPSPEQLKFFGYAPGNYASRCFRCEKIVEWLDKRASCCLPCAQAAYQKYLAHFGSASPHLSDFEWEVRSKLSFATAEKILSDRIAIKDEAREEDK